jgi:diketogulonate reductase-like aldo/keto reductase
MLQGYIPLPKSPSKARIVSNIQVFDFELSPEDMNHLDGLNEGQHYDDSSDTGRPHR